MINRPDNSPQETPAKHWHGLLARSFIISILTGLILLWTMPAPVHLIALAALLLFLALFGIDLLSLRLGWSAPPRFSFRRAASHALRLMLFVTIAAALKLFWFEHYVLQSSDLLSDCCHIDLLERRAHLLERVATNTFGPHDIPALIESPFREELAIATLSMTTVAFTNLAFLDPATRESSKEAVARMIERMLTPEIRRFEILWWGQDALDSLDRPEGQIGYLGHLNLMLGCYRLLGGDARYDDLFNRISAALARRLAESPAFHAETFPGATFTADNTIVILSLRLHDLLTDAEHQPLIDNWVNYSREHLIDPKTGMLRYLVLTDGTAAGTARGVLQAWNSMWLPLIDATWAKDQYDRMRQHLMDRLSLGGLYGIREYPPGVSGPTDLISGPIIFGISSAATGFAIGGAVLWKDDELLTGLLRTSELVGSTLSWNGKRSYLLAPLPGEAIVLAAKTMTRWDTRYVITE